LKGFNTRVCNHHSSSWKLDVLKTSHFRPEGCVDCSAHLVCNAHDLRFIYSWAKININNLSGLRRIRKLKGEVSEEGEVSKRLFIFFFLMYIQYMNVFTVFPLSHIFSGNFFRKKIIPVNLCACWIFPFRDNSRQNTGTWLLCPNFHIQRLDGMGPKEFYNSESTP
jgi:hypothetical protein